MYLLVRVYSSKSILKSCTVLFGLLVSKESFHSLGLGFCKFCLQSVHNTSRYMREVRNKFSSQNFIVISLDHDFSSKLCFEEKSSISSFAINAMYIFKVFQLWRCSGAALVILCRNPMPIIPAKIDKSFIIQVKKVKMETKKQNLY